MFKKQYLIVEIDFTAIYVIYKFLKIDMRNVHIFQYI